MDGLSARTKRINVLINAIGTMLVYTSFFAGTMLMPTLLKGKLEEQTIFYSMAVHCLTAALTSPVSMFIIKHFGAKISLIVGSICCMLFYISVMFPIPGVVFAAQSVFGFGLALVRPASLNFLVKNSSPSAMGVNSSIHWGVFMSSMIWGNAVVYCLTYGNYYDARTRVTVYGILLGLNMLGTVMYVLLRTPPRTSDTERKPLLDGMKEDLNPVTFGNLIKETFSLVILKQTVWLIPSMLAAGFYFTMYCVEIPTMIGSHIALFGIMVGVGELLGSLVLGRIISAFGYVLVTIMAGCLAIISLLLTCTSLPKNSGDEFTEAPGLAMLMAVALAYGVSDAGNHLALNSIIGRLFDERSEVIFCVLSCVMNLAAMTWYFVYTVVAWETIIVATGLSVFASMLGIFIVVRPK
ncbi:UNC93-like protein MFSD11 [Bolinopsis microptera]|uniref:UNC93-like protein MFSD11 n=1 Tax=Bolinopsis microptera TaxID=2820187 RepID=UPI00307A7248